MSPKLHLQLAELLVKPSREFFNGHRFGLLAEIHRISVVRKMTMYSRLRRQLVLFVFLAFPWPLGEVLQAQTLRVPYVSLSPTAGPLETDESPIRRNQHA